jgi:hypothetical protein
LGTSEITVLEPFSFHGTDYAPFFAGAVRTGSLVVKNVRQNDPTRTELTLANGPNLINANGIKSGSITLASDSSLGRIYVENIDYVVDYGNGSLALKSDGDLAVGQTVVVWHYPFHLYLEESDYRVDYDQAEIARLASGEIADRETVYLEYSPELSLFNNQLVEAGVRDANALIEAEIDPDREFGADPVLVSAATYRALEIICRAAAARELASRKGLYQTATGWLKLGETYAELAERWLKSFRPPVQPPASPTIS